MINKKYSINETVSDFNTQISNLQKSMKYQVGNSITLDNWFDCVGLTGLATGTIYFTIDLPKEIDSSVSNVTFSNLKVLIKSPSARVSSTDLAADNTYTITTSLIKTLGKINVVVEGFGSTFNAHQPLVIELQKNTSFTFN